MDSQTKIRTFFPCQIGGANGVCIYPEAQFGHCGENDDGELKGCYRAKAYLIRCMNGSGDSVPYTLYVNDTGAALSLLRDGGKGFVVEKGYSREILK